MHLINNLYCYIWRGMGNNCNSYLFAGEPLTLVDPGHVRNELGEPCLEILLDAMKKDGFEPQDVELVILTHSHPDHCEAAATLIRESKAKLAMNRGEEKYFKTMGERMSRLFGLEPTTLQPDFFLAEGNLRLGRRDGVELTVLMTPGHSPGSISLYWEEERALLTGDVIFAGSIGRTDLPGGNGRMLKQSIERLSQLNVEYLLPGHMDIVTGKKNVERNFALVKAMFFPYL
jgi:glyoxylase-like metal-dependent hydrolase (beta-lactamase superfamily II)